MRRLCCIRVDTKYIPRVVSMQTTRTLMTSSMYASIPIVFGENQLANIAMQVYWVVWKHHSKISHDFVESGTSNIGKHGSNYITLPRSDYRKQ